MAIIWSPSWWLFHYIPSLMSASSDHRSTTNWPLIYSEYEASFSMYLIQLSNLFFPHQILCFGTGKCCEHKNMKRRQRKRNCSTVAACLSIIMLFVFDVKLFCVFFLHFLHKPHSKEYHTRWSSHNDAYMLDEAFKASTNEKAILVRPGHMKWNRSEYEIFKPKENG